jgi:hypothetical protein
MDTWIKLRILEENLQEVLDAFLYLYPNNEKIPKEGAKPNPETGEYNPEDLVNKWTDKQWLEEKTRRWFAEQIARGKLLMEKEKIKINNTDGLVTR